MSTAIRSTSTQATVRSAMWLVVVVVAMFGSLSACADTGARQGPPSQETVSLVDDEEGEGDGCGRNGRTNRYADGENERDERERDENERDENERGENERGENERDENERDENERDEHEADEHEADEHEEDEDGDDD